MMADLGRVVVNGVGLVDLALVFQDGHAGFHLVPNHLIEGARALRTLNKGCAETGVALDHRSPVSGDITDGERAFVPGAGGKGEAAVIGSRMDCLADEDAILHQRAGSDAVDLPDRGRCRSFELSKESSARLRDGALRLSKGRETRSRQAAAGGGPDDELRKKLGKCVVFQNVDDVGLHALRATPGHKLDGAEGVAALGQE